MKSIKRRDFLSDVSALSIGAATLPLLNAGCSKTETPEGKSAKKKPNFVILFADDMGYGDWTRGGHPTIRTPNLNRMADEGVQMTQFYSGNPVCSASRSALLTGRNNIRTGVLHVFFPQNDRGMSTAEITIADALKPLGYNTACIGKWHLGHTYEYRPVRQGFDYYYGILYSNDMKDPDIYRNDEMIEHPSDQTTLTKRYTEEAVRFIEKSKDNPFFLYLPYTFPHIPLFASEKFLNTSRRALYGDVIEEIDWSVGQILDTLKRLGLDDNTLVFFTSDNGPWMTKDIRGGTAASLRGAKGDTFEGGMREPGIAWWPGRLPAGQVNMNMGSVLDFFPTCVELAGGTVPTDRPYDGINLMPILEGRESPERIIYYYRHQYLCAVRKGKWKLHFRYLDHPGREYTYSNKSWIDADTPMLYDLEVDPSERFDLAEEHPEIVKELTAIAENYKAEIERNGENRDLAEWFINGQK